MGQKIEAEVISTDNNRLSLSIKRLLPDPWIKEAENYKVGQVVEGKVTKITPYGAFVKVGVLDGLVHISELGTNILDAREVIEEGNRPKRKKRQKEKRLSPTYVGPPDPAERGYREANDR